MAKSNGILKIEGTVEDLTFYKKDGKNFVRRKGGISKSRIENDPNFVRTRENNNEFKLCADSGRIIRLAIGNLLFKAKDNKLSSRMLQTMFRIKDFDTTSTRGNRQVSIGLSTAGGKQLLKGFDFNINAPYKSVFFGSLTLDTATGIVSIPNFIPAEGLQFPQGATHVSFQSSVLGIKLETEESELFSSSVENLPITMTSANVTLTPTSMPSSFPVMVFLIMISFYQEVNGVQYSLKNEEYNVLNVLDVI